MDIKKRLRLSIKIFVIAVFISAGLQPSIVQAENPTPWV